MSSTRVLMETSKESRRVRWRLSTPLLGAGRRTLRVGLRRKVRRRLSMVLAPFIVVGWSD